MKAAATPMPRSPATTAPAQSASLLTLAAVTSPVDTAAALRAVPVSDDVVQYTLNCVLALAPGLQREVMTKVDRQVRDLFGRTKPYVSNGYGEGLSSRNAAIRRDHQRGEHIPLLMRRYELSAKQIRRILGQPDD